MNSDLSEINVYRSEFISFSAAFYWLAIDLLRKSTLFSS
jgi:hypothetical protein